MANKQMNVCASGIECSLRKTQPMPYSQVEYFARLDESQRRKYIKSLKRHEQLAFLDSPYAHLVPPAKLSIEQRLKQGKRP